METKDGVLQANKAAEQLANEAKLAQFHAMMDEYQPAKQEDAVAFGTELIESRRNIEAAFIGRKQIFNRELPVVRVPKEAAPAAVVMQEPQMSDKDRKELREKREKNLKEGLKMTPNATYATVDILEAEKKRNLSEKNLLPILARAVEAQKAGLDPDIYEKHQRTLGPLMDFAPGYEFDKKGNATQESAQSVFEYVNLVCMDRDKVLDDVKKEMLEKVYDPEHFTPQYVGDHFEEVRKEVDQLRSFLLIFKEGSPEYEGLKEDEKRQIDMMANNYSFVKGAFESAISCHGLSIKNNKISVSDAQPDLEQNEQMRGMLEGFRENREKMIKASWDELIEQYTQAQKDEFLEEIAGGFEKQKADPKTAFLNVEVISEYLLQAVTETKDMIDANPEKYAQNKENIDVIMKALMDSLAADHYYHIDSVSIGDAYVKAKKQNKVTPAFLDYMNRVAAKKDDEMRDIKAHVTSLIYILRSFITGDELTVAECHIMEQYGIHSDKLDAIQKQHDDNAYYHAKTFEAKQKALVEASKAVDESVPIETFTTGVVGRCVMLMKPDDKAYNMHIIRVMTKRLQLEKMHKEKRDLEQANGGLHIPFTPEQRALEQEVINEYKTIVRDYYDKVMALDLEKLNDATDDELEAINCELTDLALAGMMVSDLGNMCEDKDFELKKASNDGDEEKTRGFAVTVKDKILGKPVRADYADEKAFDKAQADYLIRAARMRCRVALIDAFERKARGISIKRSALLGTPNTGMLVKTELDKVSSVQGEESKALAMADKLIDVGQRSAEAILRRLANDPSIIPALEARADTSEYEYHQVVLELRNLQETMENAGVAIYMKNGQIDMKSSIRECRYIINDLKAKKAAGVFDEAETQMADMRIEELEQIITLAGMDLRLSSNNFSFAGEKNLLNESMFRSFAPSANLAGIKEMPEEQYREMLRKLSAGAELNEKSSEEEKQRAKAENKEGLKQYYRAISVHYNLMERKYGTKLPELDFLVEHMAEIDADFENIQIDSNFANHEEMLMDPRGEFVRLRNQIEFFNMFRGAIDALKTSLVEDLKKLKRGKIASVEYAELRKFALTVLENVQEHREYLRRHPMA